MVCRFCVVFVKQLNNFTLFLLGKVKSLEYGPPERSGRVYLDCKGGSLRSNWAFV